MHFDNRFITHLPGEAVARTGRRQVMGALWSAVEPTPVSAPRLIAASTEVARLLAIDPDTLTSPDMVAVLAGNRLLPGMRPWSANYGGHQFGNWAGQLGDGRAISLGESVGREGHRLELQLKGAGPTPYSRTADGRAVMRSSIREFLCSEAMHHLGIPTTRALALVGTGDAVMRDMFYDGNPRAEPGAIVCRVAPSFIRFGNFELPAARGDTALLAQLVDFTIARDFADCAWNRPLDPADSAGLEERRAAWFADVCERTARLIAGWMRVGFVHGVMNTDNMSILGLTIDYGPYGWTDDFNLDWTPNTTDSRERRYRFGQQGDIAHWNLRCLAGAIASLFASTDPLHAGLARFEVEWERLERENAAAKLGIVGDDTAALSLMRELQPILQAGEIDMTIFFRTLGEIDPVAPQASAFEAAFYDGARAASTAEELTAWLGRYTAMLRREARSHDDRRTAMNRVNPRFVLRNYLVQQVIDRVEAGDEHAVSELLEVLRHPYDEQPGREAFAARRPDWARDRAGCSMLSCSS